MQINVNAIPHELIFIEEAGFNLTKVRRNRRSITSHRAIVNVPGQCDGNIMMCAAITQNRVIHCQANLGPYNAGHILTFLYRRRKNGGRKDSVHCHLGQCIFPQISCGPELVSSASTICSAIPPIIISLIESHCRVFLGMAVEGL